MSDLLFSDYRAQYEKNQLFAPQSDEEVRDVLRILRRAHSAALPPELAASVVELLFTPWSKEDDVTLEESAVAVLTEAGQVALAQRDALRAADEALGVAGSSVEASPEPLPVVDPCTDDVSDESDWDSSATPITGVSPESEN